MQKLLFSIALSCLTLAACTKENAVNNLFGVSAEAPLYLGHTVTSSRQIDFSFSTDVIVRHAHFSPSIDIEKTIDGKTISVVFKNASSGGKKFTADVLVEDAHGNTLSILTPFRTHNDRVPKFVINEIRTEYDGKSKTSEFVEIKILSDGNMGAVKFFSVGSNPNTPIFEFPELEVQKGEYITVYLRELEGDKHGKKDQVIAGAKKHVHRNGVVYFTDQSNNIIDGIAFAEKKDEWNKKPALSKAAEMLNRKNKWHGDIFSSKGVSKTKTICRDESKENTHSANDWYIAPVKGNSGLSTPGAANAQKNGASAVET